MKDKYPLATRKRLQGLDKIAEKINRIRRRGSGNFMFYSTPLSIYTDHVVRGVREFSKREMKTRKTEFKDELKTHRKQIEDAEKLITEFETILNNL